MLQPKNTRKVTFAEKATTLLGSTESLWVHTLLFAGSFALVFFGVAFSNILLVVTTLVSLEAIYLAIFIQMAVNKNTESLRDVEEDVDEIQEDLDEIQEDLGEIQEDVVEIQAEERQEESRDKMTDVMLTKIKSDLSKIIGDIEKIKTDKSGL